MGAFADVASKFVSEAAEKFKGAREVPEVGSTFFSQADELGRSVEGMKVKTKLDAFELKRNQILSSLVKPVDEIHAVVKNNTQQLHSSIGQLHQEFASTSHPAAAATAKILTSDPNNAELTLKAYTQKLWGQARMAAHAQVFGENNENLIGDVMPLYESTDPRDHAHAKAILDIASNQFHDATSINTISKEGFLPDLQMIHSKVKLDIKKALVLENKIREIQGIESLPVDLNKFDTMNVREKSNALEQFASRRARYFLAPMIAINHMSTFFNYSQAPLEGIYKGLASAGNDEIKQLADASAILTSQHFSMLSDELNLESGKFATKIKRPEVARLYGKIFHNPGFNFIRNAQLKLGAAIGYHSANYWADAAAKGDRRAFAELKEMKLDPLAIIDRGGKLTEEEKVKAIWHFVNNRTFISRPLDRSLTATRSPWTRMLTMFHGYVTSQQRFMRRELSKMYQAGDYVGIARFAGTVGLLFPAVAPMLKGAEVFARTASPTTATQGVEQDYSALAHPEDVEHFTSEYLDMLSYFGSWGVMHSFITAAHGDRLALALIGPTGGDAIRTAQDAINALTKSAKSGEHNVAPLGRDLLQQLIPGAGNIASHKIFPRERRTN